MEKTERHPLEPFLPEKAVILMLGSFPPKKERWSMDFFYPNFNNDMWRIVGSVFFGDKSRFISGDGKRFDRERIMDFCREKGIALFDTATEVRRLKDNASDKFLEVLVPTDIDAILQKLPQCRAIVTTGEKATELVSARYGCGMPSPGESVPIGNGALKLYRMPSSSEAYPLPLEKKAESYRKMFSAEGLI